MKLLRKIIFSVLLFCAAGFSISAQVASDPFLNDFVSRTWTAADGLPGNTVTDILQTKDGYIYIGTYDGLVRFDGVEFLTINKNTNTEYEFVSARTLFQDSKGNFYIGANDEGVTVIKTDGTILHFDTENGLPHNSIRAMTEDKNGHIWIGTASGLCWFEDDQIKQIAGSETLPNDGNILICSLYCDTAGRMWICTMDDTGLLVYSEEKFSVYNNFKNFKNPQVGTVIQDSTGAFWFGIAPHYAIQFDGQTETVYDLSFGSQYATQVDSVFQDSHENIWFGLDTGVAVLHGGKFSYMNQFNGLSDEKITKIFEDREGDIWFATDRGGMQRLGPAKFKTIPLPTSINAIAWDSSRESLWIGGDTGLFCMQKGEFVENDITNYCKNVRVRHIEVTRNNMLLISTYSNLGQIQIDSNGKFTSYTKENGYLTGNKCRVAMQASNGDLYIGTTNGLSIINGINGKATFITKDSGIQNEFIMSLYEDTQHNIWLGTDGGGIYVLKDGKLQKHYTSEDGLSGNVIFKICSLKPDEIWVSTGTGLSRIKNEQIFNFTAATGLGTDSIFQVIPDYTQRIWFTSNKGIFSVELEELEEVADGKKSKVSAKYYGRSDGIVSGGVTSTSLSTKDDIGRLWFTLIDGIVMYDPVRSTSKNSAPIIQLQEVSVDNQHFIPEDSKVIIPQSGKRFSIKYTGLSFVSPEQVQFKYRLEGFDDDYSDWSYSRSVSYTNLKPGSYKFTVIAKNSNEIQSEPSETLYVVKKAAIWQQIWFWILVIIALCLVIFVCVKARFVHLQKENNRLQQIYVEITEALTGTIDAKDKYTNGHSNRVGLYSKMIAKRLGLSEKEQENIYMQAILHDIGKIGVPDSIINKPGKLTDEEFAVIKTHPVIGSDILKSITSLKGIEIGARSHHERYDGKGYPDGLKGEEIPFEARIIGVADAYDAMTSNRSYRNFLPQEKVREQILKGKGTQFDPEIADKMIEIIDEDTDYVLHG